jgi:hypothetical protein
MIAAAKENAMFDSLAEQMKRDDAIAARRITKSAMVAVFAAAVFGAGAEASAYAQTTGGPAPRSMAQVKGQRWTMPLTPDGQPDLQGVWVSNSATPLERPKEVNGRASLTDAEVAELTKRARRLLTDDENDFAPGDALFAAAYTNRDVFKSPTATGGSGEMITRIFDNRTSLILDPPDGRVPPLTEGARERQAAAAAAAERLPAGPEDLNNSIRCITWGVPRLGGNYGSGPYSYYRITQSAGYVAFLLEAVHHTRIFPLDGRPHLQASVRAWDGDSRGHWDGITLVVDTTNFSPKSNFMGSHENLHLTEKFTRVAADEIQYEITLDDPTTWTKPWTAMLRLRRSNENLYEFACHEGNMPTMEGILRGARAQETREKAENGRSQ